MNEKVLSEFEVKLRAKLAEIVSRVDGYKERLQLFSQTYSESVDQASQQESRNRLMSNIRTAAELRKSLVRALNSIEDGEYGYCSECGVEIGYGRLSVQLTASECIDCKTLAEIKENVLRAV